MNTQISIASFLVRITREVMGDAENGSCTRHRVMVKCIQTGEERYFPTLSEALDFVKEAAQDEGSFRREEEVLA